LGLEEVDPIAELREVRRPAEAERARLEAKRIAAKEEARLRAEVEAKREIMEQ
jgi:hypothetical protein